MLWVPREESYVSRDEAETQGGDKEGNSRIFLKGKGNKGQKVDSNIPQQFT